MQLSNKPGRRYTEMSKRKTYHLHLSFSRILFPIVAGILFVNAVPFNRTIIKPGIIRIIFKNTVKGLPLVLNDSVYTNVFGEDYRVSKLKYYIGEPGLMNQSSRQKESSGYHLIDAKDTASQSFEFTVKTGTYNSLFFLLGVDSIHNCSGAQTGALDPLNDMFWTWNSGYVMAKLEGVSTFSSSINQRIEYHIGGYKGKYNVLQQVNLAAPSPILIMEGKTTKVTIETDLSNWWQLSNPVTIKDMPICSTPGDRSLHDRDTNQPTQPGYPAEKKVTHDHQGKE